MDLKEFKSMTDPMVWQRGKSYFEKGAVSDLENDENGRWEAIVSGNDDYEVSVVIQFGHVQQWECDCPYGGSICKHVVATVMAIQDGKKNKSIDDQKNVSKSKNFTQLVDSVSADELRQFVKQHAAESKSFKQAFQGYFVDKNKSGGKNPYAKILAQTLRSGMGGHGFIDYYNAPKAFRTVFSLLEKAENYKSIKNYNEIWQIASAIIEQVNEVAYNMDDSHGMVGESFDRAFNLIYILTEASDLSISMKEQMLDWQLNAIKQSKYHDYAEDLILDSMTELAEVTNRINEVLLLLDAKIKKADGEYELTNLLEKKVRLLKSSGRLAEYDRLIQGNMELPEFRRLKVEELLVQKQWDEAIVLIKEGIKIADKQDHPGTTIQWEEQLLTVYKKSGNADKYLEILRKLFSQSNRQYYPLLKKTVGEQKWPEERTQIIQTLKKNLQDWHFLFEFYAEENMLPELMQLIDEYPNFTLLKQYEPLLLPLYSEQILALYKHVCEQYATQANGRNNYMELASMLKYVKKLNGGLSVVNQLTATFRELYKRRPAMMEELRGVD
ncbi:MAG: SWIM zinc finger family protein [Verrucomicrobia bacterium]|nr:SWIM zinc finger family protein [Prolixibacteraceae bacterium]